MEGSEPYRKHFKGIPYFSPTTILVYAGKIWDDIGRSIKVLSLRKILKSVSTLLEKLKISNKVNIEVYLLVYGFK
ncbi:hypothetical protein OA254_02655 [Prochlorococcus sp. AH-716-P05]|nr:hypothetical protein [Prochlorococcus sp. AH-716-P05]